MNLTKQELRQLVLSSPYWFNVVVMTANGLCRDVKNSKIHKILLDRWYHKSGRYKMILMPRKTLKTHSITVADSLRKAMGNPYRRILIVSETATNAYHIGEIIKNEIERNPVLHWLFPERIPEWERWKTKRWSREAMELPRPRAFMEATFEFCGIGAALQSRHYTDIYVEDPIGENAIQSQVIMQKTIEWFANLDEVLSEPYEPYWGEPTITVVGTRWAIYDFYAHIEKYDKRFKVFKIPSFDKNGNYLFPSIHNEKYVQYLLSMKDHPQKCFDFYSQHQNNPIESSFTEFKQEWLKYFKINNIKNVIETPEGEIPMNELEFIAGIDPAFSDSKWAGKSRMAIVVIGLHGKNKFLMESWAGFVSKDNYDQPFEVIKRFHERYRPRWGMEKWAQQQFIKETIQRKLKNDGITLFIHPLEAPPRKDQKKIRIKSLMEDFASGSFYIQEQQKNFINEYLTFPHAETDDILDIIAQLKQWWIGKERNTQELNEIFWDEYYKRLSKIHTLTGY